MGKPLPAFMQNSKFYLRYADDSDGESAGTMKINEG